MSAVGVPKVKQLTRKSCVLIKNLKTIIVFTNEVAEQMECEDAETQQAVDYRNMTPWQFASKYYM